MSYIINVFDPKEWDLKFDSTFYPTKPKKCQTLKKWSEDNDADLTSNLCFFNFMSSRALPGYTIQYLRIPRLGGDCGYGSNSTTELITLPNGDTVSGWSVTKQPAIRNNQLIYNPVRDYRAKNAIGRTLRGKFFTMQCSGVTQAAAAKHVINFLNKYHNDGVSLMLWEDGGGSVGTYSGKAKTLYAPLKEGANGRSVCSVFCATRKSSAPKITRTLKKGMSGSDVMLLQMIIGCVEADGVFGAGTRNQVKKVQKNLGLTADGIVGPATLKALKLG